eukprot:1557-Heterococcus_DN1.PRE.2
MVHTKGDTHYTVNTHCPYRCNADYTMKLFRQLAHNACRNISIDPCCCHRTYCYSAAVKTSVSSARAAVLEAFVPSMLCHSAQAAYTSVTLRQCR